MCDFEVFGVFLGFFFGGGVFFHLGLSVTEFFWTFSICQNLSWHVDTSHRSQHFSNEF